MESDGDEFGANGAEAARRAAVLRPLVRDYLAGTGSLESGVRDAVWELGVSRRRFGGGLDGLQRKAGEPAPWLPGSVAAAREQFWFPAMSKSSSKNT